MFVRTGLIAMAAAAALIVSGVSTAAVAASDHGKKKVAQVTKVSKTASRRTGRVSGATLDYPHTGGGGGY